MPFKLNIFLTDKDYYEINKFTITNLRYGKKLLLFMRILFAVMVFFVPVTAFISDGITNETVMNVIPSFILLLILELLLSPFMNLSLKLSVSLLKKNGKMPYSQNSVMEFDEEHFTETTDTNKTEHPYAAIERICVVGEKYIYIFITSVSGYIIPSHSFNSPKQRDEFLDFLKGKCSEIRFYKK
ncbi:MAG: YcxB family protein [Acutalibacteraceae bacterium]